MIFKMRRIWWNKIVSNSWFSTLLTIRLTSFDQRSLKSTYMFDTKLVRLENSFPYCYYWSSESKLVLGSWYPFKWTLISYLFRSENFITVFTSTIPVTALWKSWIQSTLSKLIIITSTQVTTFHWDFRPKLSNNFTYFFYYTFLTTRPIWFDPSDKIRRRMSIVLFLIVQLCEMHYPIQAFQHLSPRWFTLMTFIEMVSLCYT